MAGSPTSGMVSTEMRSPRRLWRSASLTAPSATWATCAPPPTTMMRLPKMVPERLRPMDGADVVDALERGHERVLGRRPRPRARSRPSGGSPLDGADRGERPDAAADPGRGGGDGRDRLGAVDDVEADRGRVGGAASGHARRAVSRATPRPAAPGRRSPTVIDSGSRPPVGSCSSKARPRAANASRVATGSRGREHQRAIGVLGDADDAGDVDATLGQRRRRRGRASRARSSSWTVNQTVTRVPPRVESMVPGRRATLSGVAAVLSAPRLSRHRRGADPSAVPSDPSSAVSLDRRARAGRSGAGDGHDPRAGPRGRRTGVERVGAARAVRDGRDAGSSSARTPARTGRRPGSTTCGPIRHVTRRARGARRRAFRAREADRRRARAAVGASSIGGVSRLRACTASGPTRPIPLFVLERRRRSA